jgi:hypothetical protein
MAKTAVKIEVIQPSSVKVPGIGSIAMACEIVIGKKNNK